MAGHHHQDTKVIAGKDFGVSVKQLAVTFTRLTTIVSIVKKSTYNVGKQDNVKTEKKSKVPELEPNK